MSGRRQAQKPGKRTINTKEGLPAGCNGPPAGKVFLERAAANLAQAVGLAHLLNANYNRHK